MERQPNTQYVLSLSYGKDSLACLEAIKRLGYPLDRIVHAEVWATDTIPADLPPMVEFKAHADRIIKDRYGIEVEHICAMKNGEKVTYEKIFYCVPKRRNSERESQSRDSRTNGTRIATNSNPDRYWIRYGFPRQKMPFCQSRLKADILDQYIRIPLHRDAKRGDGVVSSTQIHTFSPRPFEQGAKINTVQYLGIAADEPERISRHSVPS